MQPSIAYLAMNWTASIYDANPPVGFISNGNPVAAVGGHCSGFFVSPNGHVMTASHCTEYGSSIRDALIDAGGRWAYENRYFSDTRLSIRCSNMRAGISAFAARV